MGIGESAQPLVLDALAAVEIKTAQDAIHPDIDGKNLRAAIGEKQDAVGDFLAYALNPHQMFARLIGWHGGNPVEGNFARRNLPCGDKKMAGAKAETAGAKFRLRRLRQARRIRKRMKSFPNFVAKNAAQLVVDLLDLDDLLERRADEIAQRFPWFLAQDAQAGRVSLGLFQPQIAGKSGKDFSTGSSRLK